MINQDKDHRYTIEVRDNAYKGANQVKILDAAGHSGDESEITLNLKPNFGWYDVSVKVSGNYVYEKRYAGRVETGKGSFSDPLMGLVIG